MAALPSTAVYFRAKVNFNYIPKDTMAFDLSNSLQLIFSEISKSCSSKGSNAYQLKALLETTNSIEKCLIARFFCQLPWNCGSLPMLNILQDLRILTATEYILSIENGAEIQLILNDFLEANFKVITNLFIAAFNDSSNYIKLNSYLDECLRCLFNDLLKIDDLNDFGYFKISRETLPRHLVNKVKQKHFDIILDLHSGSIREAFRNFSTWINEGVDNIKFTTNFYEQFIFSDEQSALLYLFKLSSMEHFKEWKFYLILLQTITNKCSHDSLIFIKKYLKQRVVQIASISNQNALLHLLLTARAATASTSDINKNLEAYANWYKENIGEMKFVLKTEDFHSMIVLLEQCIHFEMEVDYLEIHSSISISPPVLCGKIVHNYRSNCKFRLSQLKQQSNEAKKDPSILIEDSDD